MNPRQPSRSISEWMELISQCRQSGLSDRIWCGQQGIPASTFYKCGNRAAENGMCQSRAIKRGKKISMNLTAKQEVVRIDIVPEPEAVPEDDCTGACPGSPARADQRIRKGKR